MKIFLLSVALALPVAQAISAAGNVQPCVTSDATQQEAAFSIVDENSGATSIFLAEDEWAGVQRAAQDFADDIERVTSIRPSVSNTTSGAGNSTGESAIIIGTLGHSSVISSLVNSSALDVSSIEGKWETYISQTIQLNGSTVTELEGVQEAYVIVGSDKRGTIYGIYDHSEAAGVSPWYWWADVPVRHQDTLYASSTGCTSGPPTVQYRGIFINDEQPALQNWAMEKFTNGTGSAEMGSPFNHLFYEKLFELLLRLKANYMWPAMWGSAFSIDDPLNQPLADYYGIAMGTSHQEPMARSSPNEWNLYGSGPWNYTSNRDNVYDYFVDGVTRAKDYETVFTMGMRGSGDLPLEESTNIALLEQIVEDQRQILSDVFNGTDISTIPQVWTLYKEVQGYYENGMRVPDDITLLWADDNWGTICRFPTAAERNRTGGAGVYYHVDYVGDPRDYKWITSTQLSKVWEQMSLAVERNATKLWIVNVGDLKPYERETEFFLTLGWNATQWNRLNVDSFVTQWATREFGFEEEEAQVVTDIVANLTRFNARRKPELLNSTTFSLINYREAERVLADWDALEEASTSIYDGLPSEAEAAYYQLIQHAVVASANLNRIQIAAGQNQLRASQARLSSNALADRVEELFEHDYDLGDDYHHLLDGKWDHIMDQTHVGYYYWQQPLTNAMPSITRVQSRKIALPGPMRVTIEGSAGAWPGDNVNNCAQGYNCPPATLRLDNYHPFGNSYIDVSAGGPLSFSFTATTNVSWLSLSSTSGNISPDEPEQRIYVSVADWSQLPAGTQIASIDLKAEVPDLPKGQPNTAAQVLVSAVKNGAPADFHGFVEGGGVISIEAAHATRNNSVDGVSWFEIPRLGKTLSAVTPLPRVRDDDAPFPFGEGPSLEYDIYNFNKLANNTLNATVFVSPVLNSYDMDRPISFGAAFDSQTFPNVSFVPAAAPGTLPTPWKGLDGWVANSIISVPLTFTGVSSGAHTLKIYMTEPGVVIQKIVINAGGLLSSYLGPPESIVI